MNKISKLRDELYDALPTGDIHAFELIKIINAHIKKLDLIINEPPIEFEFLHWVFDNHYSRYWGSDLPNKNKWYKSYTLPDRQYYTDDELFQLFKQTAPSTPVATISHKEDERDLIIQGLEEGSELWKAEYDNCRAILTELVYLKTLKDSKGKTEEYEQRQPLAWITAKKFLEKYQHQ